MLFKVQYHGKKKYIKLNGASHSEFLKEAKVKFSISTETDIYVLDDTGTEVDEEVFTDILEEKRTSCGRLLMFFQSLLVKRVLEQKPGGEKILKEYAMRGEIKDRTRRELVNIIVADMVEKYGRAPPKDKRTQYAWGIVTLFPSLKDPYSKKGYVLQDFDLLFRAETSSKLLEKWGTLLKVKVIQQAKNLSKTPLLDYLIQSAEENPDEDDEVPGWDSDMASLLLLVYLLPPPPSGKKGAVKISIREAVDRVVKFHKSSRSLQEHSGPDQRRQPYILAVGTARNSIHQYYIAMDNGLLPCNARSSLSAFDELFKAHYVFGVSYDQALNSMFTFVQTTIYNIDIGLSHETPRVKDLRAKLLN
ncbi:uncharacterized protein LOC129115521 [Anoplopoma fimbria]|uniref:uncharacterized protein LOC129115521 n=1 Tax=Anoplopoma fimbria TaxID=229290 RepID=UPI0023EBDFC4|nr:uncharacterized protein LOC129115521 [Anoplopoma fimbria]